MDIQQGLGLIFEPYNSNFKRCGCYSKRPVQLLGAKPKTHVAMPLKHIDYQIQITNGLASISLQQKYFNPTDKFLEIEFSFPIDPNACIYKFVAEFGNKRIQGVVKEKQQAKLQYQQAVREGKQAVYAQIDPNSKDIMNMQIGNVGPSQQVRISISYLQELNIQQNTFYQLHLPSTISPRYMNSAVGKRYVQNVKSVTGQYTWTFKISLLTTRRLVYYVSSSHNLNLISQNQGQTQTILCLPNQAKPNSDLFLLFTVQDFHLPSYVFGRTDVSSTAMLSFIPKFCELSLDDAMKASMTNKQLQTDVIAAKGQYIFLLDRSGSMGGTRIKKAIQALVLFLQSLPQDTYFNVISFGNKSQYLQNNSIRYNNANLKNAVQKIKAMSADMGGTQIYAPLFSLFTQKVIKGYPRQIFLLTDGGVSNTQGVIALVGRQTKYSRCHSIGIGNGCSQALIKGCAQKGKGKYIFIDDSQNPSQKIIGLLEETLTPVIDNVDLKYEKDLVLSIVPNPQSLAYILKNQVVNFYITFKGQLDKKANFTFSYKDSKNKVPFQTKIQVDPQSQNIPFVDKMAHNKVIKNLQAAAKQDRPVQDMMYYVKVTDKKQQAIDQSVKHQILSQYTAFICVGKELVDGKFEEIKQKGQQKIKLQPIIPQDLSLRGQMLDKLPRNYCNKTLSFQNSIKSSKKKSSTGFMGNIVNGMSNFFGGSDKNKASPMNSMKQPQMRMMQQPQMHMMQQPKMHQRSMHMMQYKMEITQNKHSTNFDELRKTNIKNGSRGGAKHHAERSLKREIQSTKVQQKEESMKHQFGQHQMEQSQMKLPEQPTINKMQMQFDESQQQQDEQTKTLTKSKKADISISKAISIQQVISQQNADGRFSSQKLLRRLFSDQYGKIKKECEARSVPVDVYITYLISKWMQRYHPEKQYSLVIKKAYSWVKRSTKLEDLRFLDAFIN